jgi:hypothetical protein
MIGESRGFQPAVVVTMFPVRMVQVSLDEIVCVVAMEHGLVAA